MEIKKIGDLNLSFGVKDYSRSKENHKSRIKTRKNRGRKYRDIIDVYFEDWLTSEIVQSTQFHFYYEDIFKDGVNKSNVRQLKTFVNWKARELIQKGLEFNDLSKYYGTAFYVIHYAKINQLMKKVTRILLKEYLGG